jgi:hypothetical protein
MVPEPGAATMKHHGPIQPDDMLATLISVFFIGLILGLWVMAGVMAP